MNVVSGNTKILFKRIVVTATVALVCASLVGCEAFVRKFTRKKKKDNLVREELVLEPEPYVAPQMTVEDRYRQYFLFWKSWHDEMIESLNGSNHKKQVLCMDEVIKNMNKLKALLTGDVQARLLKFTEELLALRNAVSNDVYGHNKRNNRITAERIKKSILAQFSYHKVASAMVPERPAQ